VSYFCLFRGVIVAAGLALYSPLLQAMVPVSSAVGSGSDRGLGTISTNLLEGPIGTLAELSYKVCYLIGVGLLMTAGIRYRKHRQNPNQVRMGEVIMLLLLGLALFLLPLLLHVSLGAQILDDIGFGT
jgi:hypothetical protein